MALWYVARENELLIDLDHAARPTTNGPPWIEGFFRRRLRDAIADRKLRVLDVYLAPSSSPKHYHAAVVLAGALPVIERLVWQLHLGSDLYRGRADLMRAARGYAAPSLLIRGAPIPGGFRDPDRECRCTGKHLTSAQPDCDVWRDLRGVSPWDLFGRSDPTAVERGVPLASGRVPLARIMARQLVTRKGTDDESTRSSTDAPRARPAAQ